MPQSITLVSRGLFTYPNPLSARPEGSLQIAKNLVIDRENTAEPRRGYSELNYPLGTSTSNRSDQIMTFGGADLIAHYGAASAPTRTAFFMFEEEFTAVIASGSNVISDIVATSSFYSSAIVRGVETQTVFLGDQTLGSNTITNILSTQGLYVGLQVGGRGIPLNTTITSVSGTGPYTITISNNALYTQAGNTITASDINLITFSTDTRAVVINSSNIVCDNTAPYTSRTINFLPADVNTTTDIITIANHGLVDGDSVQFTTSGTLPAPLATSTVYYIVQSTNDTFRLATTSGGTGINLTTQGTGTHTLTVRDIFTIGGWIDHPGVFEKPEGNIKMRYAEQNNSLFVTTKEGIRKYDNFAGLKFLATVTDGSNVISSTNILDVTVGEFVLGPGIPDGSYVTNLLSANSFEISSNVSLPSGVASATNQLIRVQPRLAGVPYALDGEAVLTTDFTGFLPTDRAVQYFILWGYKDANNRIARSAPSPSLGIVVSNNTGESKNVQIKFTVPDGITPAHFYQVYRSGQAATASSTPPSEARLIYEANPTYSEVVSKIVTFSDNVPEDLRSGEILYTSEGQEGRLLGNYPPPFGTDVASFKNSLFVSNTKTKQQLALTILSVSGSFSILGDTDNSTAFKSLTISNPVLTVTGDTTSGSALITNLSTVEMGAIAIGMSITGSGIPSGTYVAGYESPTSVRLTKAATATAASVALTLGIAGVAQGQNVFGSPFAANTKISAIFSAASVVTDLLSGSPIIHNLTSVAGLKIGQPVTAGAGIPAGALIQETYAAKALTFANNNVDVSADTITLISHGFSDGNVVRFVGTSLPGGVSAGVDYYIISSTTNTFQISTSFGGAAVNITGVGSGSIERFNQVQMTDNATSTITGAVVSFGAGYRIDTAVTATAVATTVTFKNGSSGIEAGDTLTIAGVTYTAANVEDYSGSNRNFKVYAHGTPAQNITNTALSLVRVINRQTSASGNPDVYAQYTSQVNGLPGEIVFQARTFNGGQFYATADSIASGQAYTPALPAAGGTTVPSKNDVVKNNLVYSKSDLPEAFPLGYAQPVGNEKSEAIRIIPLRDSLFDLKEDGVFRVTGEDPTSFRPSTFDNTITLAAPESVAKMDNTIFALSREGVQAITDSKSDNISTPIQDLILDVFEKSEAKVRALSFAFTYDSDKKYVLYTIENATDTTATQAFVYNVQTNTWTTWERPPTCGVVLGDDDLIYYGRSDKNTFKCERKDRNYTDYLDDTFDVDIVTLTGVLTSGSNQITLILPDTTSLTVGQIVSGTGIPENTKITAINNNFTITMSKAATMSATVELAFENGALVRLSNVLNTKAGDVLYQNDGRFTIILEVDNDKNTLLTRNPINSWTLGTAQILVAIESVLQYNPQTCGNPSAVKQVTEFVGMFQTPFFDIIDVSFNSDLSGGEESVELTGQIGGVLWGLYSWGEVIWGGIVRPAPLRTYVPRDKQRNTQLNITLTHREAYAYYRLSGVQLYYNTGNQRVRR